MDCAILYNVPTTYSDLENWHLREMNNKSNHDEDLIELSIEEISQSWKDHADGRDLPVSSASFQGPFHEVATTFTKMQGDNYASIIPKNFTKTDIISGNSKFSPATRTINEEDVVDPIQEVNEIDLETIVDLLRMEENGELDIPNCQPQHTSESQADKKAKAQVDHGVSGKKKEDSNLSAKEPNSGHWNNHEHKLFLAGIERYGRQWRDISNLIKTRTPSQVRSHAQKHFSKDPDLKERSTRRSPKEARPMKRQRFTRSEVVSHDNTTSKGEFDHNFSGIRQGRWLEKEHDLFVEGVKKFGRDWRKVSTVVKTRTVIQIRTHAQKCFEKVGKLPETIST